MYSRFHFHNLQVCSDDVLLVEETTVSFPQDVGFVHQDFIKKRGKPWCVLLKQWRNWGLASLRLIYEHWLMTNELLLVITYIQVRNADNNFFRSYLFWTYLNALYLCFCASVLVNYSSRQCCWRWPAREHWTERCHNSQSKEFLSNVDLVVVLLSHHFSHRNSYYNRHNWNC